MISRSQTISGQSSLWTKLREECVSSSRISSLHTDNQMSTLLFWVRIVNYSIDALIRFSHVWSHILAPYTSWIGGSIFKFHWNKFLLLMPGLFYIQICRLSRTIASGDKLIAISTISTTQFSGLWSRKAWRTQRLRTFLKTLTQDKKTKSFSLTSASITIRLKRFTGKALFSVTDTNRLKTDIKMSRIKWVQKLTKRSRFLWDRLLNWLETLIK